MIYDHQRQIPARFWHTLNSIHNYTCQWQRFHHPKLKGEYLAILEPTRHGGYSAKVFVNWGKPFSWCFTGYGKTHEDAIQDVKDEMISEGIY